MQVNADLVASVHLGCYPAALDLPFECVCVLAFVHTAVCGLFTQEILTSSSSSSSTFLQKGRAVLGVQIHQTKPSVTKLLWV